MRLMCLPPLLAILGCVPEHQHPLDHEHDLPQHEHDDWLVGWSHVRFASSHTHDSDVAVLVPGRTLDYVKELGPQESTLHIEFEDTLGFDLGDDNQCRWTVLLDDEHCADWELRAVLSGDENDEGLPSHTFTTRGGVSGWCGANQSGQFGAGQEVTISVQVVLQNANSDPARCFTGNDDVMGHLVVEEWLLP